MSTQNADEVRVIEEALADSDTDWWSPNIVYYERAAQIALAALWDAGFVIVKRDSLGNALIDGSLHPAACGPGCRSQHTDDHSRCTLNDGTGAAK